MEVHQWIRDAEDRGLFKHNPEQQRSKACGVNIEWLGRLSKSLLEAGLITHSSSTRAVVNEVFRAAHDHFNTRTLLDLVPSEYVGLASVYISHSWDESFFFMCDALEKDFTLKWQAHSAFTESRERRESIRSEAAEATTKEAAEEGMDIEEVLGQIQAYSACQAQWQKSRQARAAPLLGQSSWGADIKEQPPSSKQLPSIGHHKLQPLHTATSASPGPASLSPHSPTSPSACITLPALKLRHSTGSSEFQAADSSRMSVVQHRGNNSSLSGGVASQNTVLGPAGGKEAGPGSPKAKEFQNGLLPTLALPKHTSTGSSASSPKEFAASGAISPEAYAQSSPKRTRVRRTNSLLKSNEGHLASKLQQSHSSPALDKLGTVQTIQPAEHQKRDSNPGGAEKGKKKSIARELLLRNQGNRSKVVSFRAASDSGKAMPQKNRNAEQQQQQQKQQQQPHQQPHQQQQQQQHWQYSSQQEDPSMSVSVEAIQEMNGPHQGSATIQVHIDLSGNADAISTPEDEAAGQPETASSHRNPLTSVRMEHLGQQDRILLKNKQQINGFIVWIDIFSLPQHQPCQPQREEDVKVAISEAVSMIKCIGRVNLILGARMLALSRIWVLYEIWSALKMKRTLYTLSLVEPAPRHQPRASTPGIGSEAAASSEPGMQDRLLPGVLPEVNLKASKAAVPLHRLCILSNWLAEVESPKCNVASLDYIAISIREGVLAALVREQKRPLLVQSMYAGLHKCRWTWRYKDQGMQPLSRDVKDTTDALLAFADLLFKREMETDPALQLTRKGGDAELYLWQLIKFILRHLVLTRDEPAWILPLKHYECIAERSFSSRFSNDILSEMIEERL
ncbi:hypothetical protein DUNSADRAFT_5880 [Dunaliella salina]|uniref:Uncharacterized protein n=1 Tax=Dunaliella salina TaxID=3046 RepID=A0ABQ7GPG7_DUNSA|nr:hypothetical protein DUNSADRAFT_5880 [Dunaliella salina]|eukprot:KAF5836494.1 hypothetical protein DUNSADRAFT_5880 [Dunaliella salina]